VFIAVAPYFDIFLFFLRSLVYKIQQNSAYPDQMGRQAIRLCVENPDNWIFL
jgi:hypothetical protein